MYQNRKVYSIILLPININNYLRIGLHCNDATDNLGKEELQKTLDKFKEYQSLNKAGTDSDRFLII